MKFMMYRAPGARSQKVPYPALQVSGLADAARVLFQADRGYVLLSRKDFSIEDAVHMIVQLRDMIDSLVLQLVDACSQAAREPVDTPDPLDELDRTVLDELIEAGADPNGLRELIRKERGGRG